MHPGELVELAALLASRASALAGGTWRLSESRTQRYWVVSKCRLDRWSRTIKQYRELSADAQGPLPQDHPSWIQTRGVIEEIFTSEVLARVWAGVACAWDRRRGTDDVEPAANIVLSGHLDARHRSLNLLVDAVAIDTRQAVRLNRLRRRSERWTDLLIGALLSTADVSHLAYDAQRARDFAEDLSEDTCSDSGGQSWPMLMDSLRAAFSGHRRSYAPNADLNAQIATAVMATLPPEFLGSAGLSDPLWEIRLANFTTDAEDLVAELMCLDTLKSE